MSLAELVSKLFLVVAEGVILFLLSRALFVWVLQALASRNPRKRGGWLVQLVRLPGNLVHEISHALAFLICGYRVRRLVPCVFDREGRGACQPGRPWSPVALPWLATGVAALAPLIVGTLALYGVTRWLDLPLSANLSISAPGRSLIESLYSGLLSLDYRSPQTWLFLYLAFTIGAELAPSGTDVRQGIPALLVVSLVTVAALLGIYQLDPQAPLRLAAIRETASALEGLSNILSFGLMTTALVTVLTFLPAALIRTARG